MSRKHKKRLLYINYAYLNEFAIYSKQEIQKQTYEKQKKNMSMITIIPYFVGGRERKMRLIRGK